MSQSSSTIARPGEQVYRPPLIRPKAVKRALKIALLLVLMFLYFLPIWWLIKSSFQPESEIKTTEFSLITLSPTLENFAKALSDPNFLLWFRNSIILAVATAAIAICTASLAAYSLARVPVRFTRLGARFYFLAYIAPGVMVVIPLYVVLSAFKLTDTYLGLIITYTSFAIPFSTWLLRAYFASLPADLEDAALVDGCTRLGALWRVVLPISAPGLATVALFSFILAWNDVLFAVIFTNSTEMRTLSIGLRFYARDAMGIGASSATSHGIGSVYAMSLLVVAPAFLIFVLLQQYLVRGLAAGAVKG
jgi:multiple sugar transport system permease protein